MALPPTTADANVVERKDLREPNASVAVDFGSVLIDNENAATSELLRPRRKRVRSDFAIVLIKMPDMRSCVQLISL